MRDRPRAARSVALLALLPLGFPPSARATVAPPEPVWLLHPHLVSSSPARGETLSVPPPTIQLVFSEPVEVALSEVRIVAARDTIAIPLHTDSTDARALIGDLPALSPGTYRVEWRVVAADGHPVAGRYEFVVAGFETAAGSTLLPPAHEEAAHERAGPHASVGVSALLRGLAMFSLLALAGWLLQMVLCGEEAPRGGLRSALVLAVIATFLLGGHFAAWLWHVTPPGRTLELAAALRTGPGRVEALRIGLVLLTVVTILVARRPWIALGFAFAAVLVSGATGHSAGMVPRWSIPLKSLHLVAVSVWIGGVAWLATAALGPDSFRTATWRVSSLALGAVVLVAVTGAAQTALFLPGWGALAGSAYGRLVLAKVAGLAGLLGFGAHHRRALLPRLAAGDAPAALRRSTRFEAVLMLLVSILAGILAYAPPPS